MFSMENPPKARRARNPHSLVQGQVATGALNLVEKAKSLHFLWTLATDVGKVSPQSSVLLKADTGQT